MNLVIIPTYNEIENIDSILKEVLDYNTHILVVDDNSADGTADAVKSLMKDHPERLFIHERSGKLGLGTAYIAGFKWALERDYQTIIEMDADFSHDPKILPKMIETLKSSDVVIGSRYVDGGGTVNWSLLRQAISQFGGIYARCILGMQVKDLTGGYNGWTRKVLSEMDLNSVKSEGYAFQIELKYRAHNLGANIEEIPIIFHDRRAGKSKMSVWIVIEAMLRVWLLRFG